MKQIGIVVFLMVYGVASFAEPPVIHSPRNGLKLGVPGDECEEGAACTSVPAEGWIPADRVPVWVVAPEKRAPQLWVQQIVPGVAADGTVGAEVRLGEIHEGAEQWFKIYLLACERDHGLTAGEKTFDDLPPSCEMSSPVRVLRLR